MGKVKTRSKDSSPSPENDKNELREALCALKNGVPENNVVEWADSEMNGVSSLLKMRGSGRSLKLSSGIEGGRKFGDELVSVDVSIVDRRENKDMGMDDLVDQECGFGVGDFVWGKIKSHPWWPGRIFDPSDASDFALKLRQKNRLLVAYFGDGTFAWCHPSRLKRFEDNFEYMIKQSSSRAFVNAVQEAVSEVGRLLESKMGDSFVVKKSGNEFSAALANNSGIKEGVLIAENGIERLSDVLIDPAGLLCRVKQIVEVGSVSSILELEILKARLSAFYLWRGGYKLPIYEVPRPIPGLEDSSRDKPEHVGSSEGAVETPFFQGPLEEDCATLLMSSESGELCSSHMISGNKLNHRIKQKSIADILRESKDVNTKDKIKEGDATKKVIVKKKREDGEDAMVSKAAQKRKGVLSSTDGNMVSDDNDSGGKENSDDRLKQKKGVLRLGNDNTSSCRKKKTDEEAKAKEQNENVSSPRERKRSKYLSPPFTTPIREQMKVDTETKSPSINAPPSETMTGASDQHIQSPVHSTKSISIKAPSSELVTGASDQLLKSPAPSECDGEVFRDSISKEISIEQDFQDSFSKEISIHKENSDKRTLQRLKQKKGASRLGNENTSSCRKKTTDEEAMAKEQNEKVSSPRERKRSKYLSPPFTTPTREQRKVDTETKSLSIKSPPSGPVSGASDQHIQSPVSSTKSISIKAPPPEPVTGPSDQHIQSHVPSTKSLSVKARPSEPVTGASDQHIESPIPSTKSLSIKALPSEPVTEASDQHLKSHVAKCNGKVFQDGFSKELFIEQDPPKNDKNKTFDTTKIEPSSGEVLYDVRYAAVTPKILGDIKSIEKIVDFMFIYRNSIYHKGSYRKIYKKHQSSKKRRKPDSDIRILRRDQNQTDHMSPTNDSETEKRRRKNFTTSGVPEEKQAVVAETGKKASDENPSAAALLVSFRPGSSLPSKSDLNTLYSKFGALNESETAVFSSNHTAQVLFLKASNAEKALSHSQKTSPFGSSEVIFRLQYLSGVSRSQEHSEKSKSKPKSKASSSKKHITPANPSASLSPGSGETSKLNYIKQKLQGLTSMLEASDGKSPAMKMKIESGMKGLLEDVNKMVEASSS